MSYLEQQLVERLPGNYRQKYRTLLRAHADMLPVRHPDCRITLVIPAFREEELIHEALQSLSMQKDVEMDAFEVIVVVNYPEGQPPMVNEYDETGRKTGEHQDRTCEQVKQFGVEHPEMHLWCVKQPFPEEVEYDEGRSVKLAGVGIASKLGMDLAYIRQHEQNGIIARYGADTTFDLHWISHLLKSFEDPSVDAVRGTHGEAQFIREVEDNNTLISLTEEELKEIREINRLWEYYKLVIDLQNLLRPEEAQRQKAGIAALRSAMYAKIGGMNIKRGGEDWQFANDVVDVGGGNILFNPKMTTTIWGRIEPARTEGGSFTDDMWRAYRAWKYNENIDEDGDLLVENPVCFVNQELCDAQGSEPLTMGVTKAIHKIERLIHEQKTKLDQAV